MKFRYFLVLALFTATIMVACKDDDDDDNYNVNAAQFMQDAASSGMFEVAAGRLAILNGGSPEVVAFGQQMVNDHSAANNELMTLAGQKNVMLPDTMDAAKQQIYARLAGKSGEAFDQDYMDTMIEVHNMDIEKFEDASEKANDGDVRTWAANKLPILRTHRDMAEEIETDL